MLKMYQLNGCGHKRVPDCRNGCTKRSRCKLI